MARQMRDSRLETRSARHRLKASVKPYFRPLDKGLHIGYRRLASGPGTWVVRRYLSAGRYRVENLRTADDRLIVADDYEDSNGKDVLDFGQAQKHALLMKRPAAKTAGPYTVNDAMADYFADLKEQRKPTKEAERRHTVFIQPALGGLEVIRLTSDRIKRWHRDLAKRPPRLRTKKGAEQRYREADQSDDAVRARQATANRILTILKAALNLAWRDRRESVPSDDAWRGVAPFPNVDKARVRYLAIAEATRLVNAADLDFRPLVQAALLTGARYQQIARLRASDFNPDVGTVRLVSRKGKGSREKVYHATLTAEGVAFFRAVSAGHTGEQLLFPNEGRVQRAIARECERLERLGAEADRAAVERDIRAHDDGMWHDSEQNRPMIEACKRAKIAPAIGFHGLRHTWASLAVMNGTPLLVVAKNLGHSDTRMVEKHYGHLAPSFVADAIRAGAPKFGFKPSKKVVALA